MPIFLCQNRKSNSETKKCVINVNVFALDLTKIHDYGNVHISYVLYYLVHFFYAPKISN